MAFARGLGTVMRTGERRASGWSARSCRTGTSACCPSGRRRPRARARRLRARRAGRRGALVAALAAALRRRPRRARPERDPGRPRLHGRRGDARPDSPIRPGPTSGRRSRPSSPPTPALGQRGAPRGQPRGRPAPRRRGLGRRAAGALRRGGAPGRGLPGGERRLGRGRAASGRVRGAGRQRAAAPPAHGGRGLVLLIACVNVAGLALARAGARSRELAIRTALGGGRAALLRVLAAEPSCSALAAGARARRWRSSWSRWIRVAGRDLLPRADEVTVDPRALLVAAGRSRSLVVVASGSCRRSARRARSTAALREGAGAGRGPARRRLRAALVVGEIALALVLLTGAGLLLRSLERLQRVPDRIRRRPAGRRADRAAIAPVRRARTRAPALPRRRGGGGAGARRRVGRAHQLRSR